MAMTVRRYVLARPTRLPLILGGSALTFGVGLWAYRQAILRGGMGQSQYAFFAVWFALCFFGAYQSLSSTKEIIVLEGDEIEFVSSFGRRRVHARDIRSIRLREGQNASTKIRLGSGTIRLAGAVNDFHQFVSEVKQANPGIELVGV